jgi:geranylgeranyl reductase family protein
MLDYYQMAFQNFRIGPASALGVLLLIGLAVPGVLVGAAVVFTRLRLTTTAEADQAPEPLLGKPLGIVSLVVALLLALPACALSVAPIPAIVTASLTDDAYGRFIESIPFGNVTMNTVLPVLLSALIQTLITYLGALGIGGLRPLGRRSELLLLLFSPWLFVSLRPLSAAIFQGMAAARNFNSFFALIPPIWLNVPMLFILTLFFKGQAPRRETASSTSSLILPSLPLTALLFCAALWVGGQDLWWPLIAGRGPQFYTAQTALTFVAAQFFTASGPMAAGLVLFSLPSFLFFFLVFSLFQVFYLERLRLEAGEDEAATPADQADDASTRLAMSAQCDVVIVGAGPGGAAAAHTLARGGLKVRLFDKAEFPRDKTCGDGLTPRALNVLDDMGLLIRLLRLGWRINTAAVVAPDGGRVAVEFPKKEDVPNYALVVPRLTLDNVLLEGAIASGAQFQGSTHVTGIASDGEGVTLTGETRGRSFSAHARLGIIATGASTKLLRQIGILKRQPETVLAARAYFEGLDGLTDCFEFRFDHLSLPGYGWLFPISEAAANVGVGLWPTSRSRRPDARSGLDSFIQNPRLQEMMAKARRAGPVKSYPIRTDFASAPVVGEKLLLVGEAAGLVNPITGEGIDYALESGQMAASHVLGMFEAGDLSQGRLETYDRLLRGRYQRLFVYCDLIRRFTFNILTLNLLVRLAARRPDLKHLLAKILLQVEDPPAISAASLLKAGWVLSRRA